MTWFVVTAGVLAVVVAVAWWAPSWAPWLRRRSAIGVVRPGAFGELLASTPAHDADLLKELGVEPPVTAADSARPAAAGREGDLSGRDAAARRRAAGDAAVAGSLAGVVGIYEWLHPDQAVLEAMAQFTHERITNSLDLWRAVGERHYELLDPHSLINWRGHVGEQQVLDQLHGWLDPGQASLWPDSNHPASDLSLFGHEYNVKVTEDYLNVGPQHFAEHPDTPLLLNSDAAHLPADALHVDMSQPFDPAILDGHAVIVADGLTASGAEDALHSAFGDAMGGMNPSDLLGAAQDAGIPVFGTAIRVVRSGIREGKLYGVHGDAGRVAKNITTDVAVTGAGVVIGQTIGQALGGVLDAAGFTFGLGTPALGAAGAAVGGYLGSKQASEIRLAPLRAAQDEARAAVASYSGAVDSVEADTATAWDGQVSEATRQSRAAAANLEVELAAVLRRARREMAADDLLGADAAQRALDDARARVTATRNHERSMLARRRARDWAAAADAAVTAEEKFDAAMAAPQGTTLARTLLADVQRRRETELAACAEASRRAATKAVRIRESIAQDLATARSELQQQARDRLSAPLESVRAATDKVLKEAEACGATVTSGMSDEPIMGRDEWVADSNGQIYPPGTTKVRG